MESILKLMYVICFCTFISVFAFIWVYGKGLGFVEIRVYFKVGIGVS